MNKDQATGHRLITQVEGLETLMLDRVWYALPLGPLGASAHCLALALAPPLPAIFGYRAEANARLLGTRAKAMPEIAARPTDQPSRGVARRSRLPLR